LIDDKACPLIFPHVAQSAVASNSASYLVNVHVVCIIYLFIYLFIYLKRNIIQ